MTLKFIDVKDFGIESIFFFQNDSLNADIVICLEKYGFVRSKS